MARTAYILSAVLLATHAAPAALPAQALRSAAANPTAPVASTLRSVVARVAEPLRLDGRLDDAAWREAVPVSGFVQIEPRQGSAASLGTEVRMAQDDEHLYVAIRAHDPEGRGGIRVRDLRRDFYWGRSDAVGLVLDGVGDARSILAFGVTPYGAQWDAQVTDGGLTDLDWDAPWSVRTTIDDEGWSAEMALPWAVLRYAPGASTWRVNFVREVPRLGESSAWSPYPRALGVFRMEYAAPLEGVAAPRAGAPLLLQPYVVGTRRTVGEGEPSAAVGGEVKWQPTARTTVDLTVNTDFAQADVDRQVVNLTRFTPFFPERRPFFLENRGLFTVGAPERLLPFFTRSVGLTAGGTPVPIEVGARAIHRGESWSGAGLVVRQGEDGGVPGATIGVARAQRSLGSRARIGALLVERVDDATEGGESRAGTTVALDAFARPRPTVTLNALVTGTTRAGDGGDGLAGWVEAQRATSALVSAASFEFVGREYAPGAGFVARADLMRASGRLTGDWRPARRPGGVRAFRPALTPSAAWRASDRRFQEAQLVARVLGVDFLDTSRLWLDVTGDWQALDRPFTVVPGVRVAAGHYAGARVGAEYQSSIARPLAVTAGASVGGYLDGHLARTNARLAWTPVPQVVLDAGHSLAAFRGVGGRAGTYVTHLLAPELRLAASPRLQLAAFYQHNTAARQGALNARLVWEFQPLSSVAVVYNARAPLPEPGGVEVAEPPRDGQLVVKVSWTRRP